jgi:hypothetical protein
LALRPEKPLSDDPKQAKRHAAEQDVFLREVDDALRQDEMLTAFQRWGKMAVVAVVILLAGLAGFLFWQQHAHQSAAKQAEQFTVALDDVEANKLGDGATKLSALIGDSRDGTKAAAQMMQAGIAIQQGKPADAVRLFDTIAADSGAPQPYRDLAAIRAVATNFDTMKPEDVVARLKPLAEPGKPWFGSAGELVGLAYLKQGKNNLAGPLFAAISRDKNVPETLRARTRQMAGLLGVDAIDDVARAAGTLPGQN